MTTRKKAAPKPEVNEGEILASSIERESVVPSIPSEAYEATIYDREGDYEDSVPDLGTCLEEAKQRLMGYFDRNATETTSRAIIFKKVPVLTVIYDLND